MLREFDPKLTWNSARDDVINEFYRPALIGCKLYQRLAGYFSSSTFANVANEILEFIESGGHIQLITSPNLTEKDKEICEQSVLAREELLSTIFFNDLKVDPDALKIEFTKLMAYMLTNYIDSKPQLEIKIAIPTTGSGMYHQKIGILQYTNDEKVSFAGSVNETGSGWHENIENFVVFRSWGDSTNNQGIIDNQTEFNNLWNNNNHEVRVYDLPNAVKSHMLQISPVSDLEFKKTLDKIKKSIRTKNIEQGTSQEYNTRLTLRPHQIEAIQAWQENNYQGLLEMATGTGKTFTAFGCLNKVQNSHKRTITIIACPQLHLIEQWRENLIKKWNVEVSESERIIIEQHTVCNSDNVKWREQLQSIIYNFNEKPMGINSYIYNNIIIFTTYDTMALPDFTKCILEIRDAKKIIVADEVHNITETKASKILLSDFNFRLGLSATPVRHLDEEGTKILHNYFQGIVYTLNLKDAIYKLNILCQYNYKPYYVELTSDEMEKYQKLTRRIAQIEVEKKKGIYHRNQNERDPYIARADLIANAENKDNVLIDILKHEFNNSLSNTLIYCTNNSSPLAPLAPKQLERVKNILSKKGIVSDSITWEDKTRDKLYIIDLLTEGHFDCITAVRCLDEGVDIPSVEVGIFMASSGNPKQFIQRRGRILRQSIDTGKTLAIIYDILVAPPTDDAFEFNTSQRKLMAKELIRHKEFASIAHNKNEAIEKIKPIAEKFSIDLDLLTYEYILNMN